MKLNKLFRVLLVSFLTMFLIFHVVIGENVSVKPNTTPIITIDPIGNHTTDEVFLIHGSTNLAVTGAPDHPLLLQIESAHANPGGVGSFYRSDVAVKAGENGVNAWSYTINASQWMTYQMIDPPMSRGASPGEYVVIIASADVNADTSQHFFLVLPEDKNKSRQVSAADTYPVKTGTGSNMSPTRQSAPIPGIFPAIAVLAVVILRVLREQE